MRRRSFRQQRTVKSHLPFEIQRPRLSTSVRQTPSHTPAPRSHIVFAESPEESSLRRVSLGPALSCPLSRTGSSPGAPCPDPHIPARAAQQLPVLRLSSPSTLALDRTTIVPDESFESVLEFRHFRPDSTNYPLPVFPLPQASLRVFLTASRHKQSTFANVCRRSFLQALPNTLSSLSGCVGSSHREDTGSE